MRKLTNFHLWCIFLSLLLAVQSLMIGALLSLPVAQAADPSSLSDSSLPSLEDGLSETGNGTFDSLTDLNWLLSSGSSSLQIAPSDVEQITNNQVDVRLTSELLRLVTPADMGGDDLGPIQVKSIIQGYDGDGIAKLGREGVPQSDEGSGAISAHNRGEAADISEVGSVTCKVVEFRHGVVGIGGGGTSHWQAPTPIKVAWQSRDGIAKNPTPKGNNLIEVSGGLSAGGLMDYINETGQLGSSIDFVKGLNLNTIAQYVGANIYLKNYASGKITDDPLADDLLHSLGAVILAQQLPSTPVGINSGNDSDSVQVAYAKARLEQDLGLPPGSLRQLGWSGVLSNTGKRTVENSLGLPSLYFESHSLSDATTQQTVLSALKYVSRNDAAFNFISGTVSKIISNDPHAFEWAGVNILATALKLNDQQRQQLTDAIKANQNPTINPEAMSFNNELSLTGVHGIFSDDQSSQQAVIAELGTLGQSILSDALKKVVPNKYSGLSQQIIDQLSRSSSIPLGDLKKSLGNSAISASAGLDPQTTTVGAKRSINQQIADAINKQYNLQSSTPITADDVANLTKKGDLSIVEKIGAISLDKTTGWNPGTGYQVITGKVSLGQAAQQIFANSLGTVFGIDTTGISLSGNLSENYGLALVAQRLGINSNSVLNSNDATALQSSLGQSSFDSTFGLPGDKSLSELRQDAAFWDNPTNNDFWHSLDSSLNAPDGTVKGYLQGSLDTHTLTKQVGQNNFKGVTANILANQFGLSGQYSLSKQDITDLLAFIQGNGDLTQNQNAINDIYKIVGVSIDSKAQYFPGMMSQLIHASNGSDQVKVLLDEGIRQIMKAIGINGNISVDDMKTYAGILKDVYNGGSPTSGGIFAQKDVSSIIVKSLQIPDKYKDDVQYFLNGDYQTGLALASYTIWNQQANPYLPPDGRITYDEFRSGFIFNDQQAVTNRANADLSAAGLSLAALPADLQKKDLDNAHREIIEESRRNTEYKVSDSFLRKSDPTIPVGFSRIMTSGSQQEKAQLLEAWGANHIDTVLAKSIPGYQAGTLQQILSGNGNAATNATVDQVLASSANDFGPFDKSFIFNYLKFLRAAPSSQQQFLTDQKYAGMWSYFDGWLGQTLDIGTLPTGISKSIYFASTHNWDLKASTTGVTSLSDLGDTFFVGKLSGWGDKEFGLQPGTTYQAYTSLKGVVDASRALSSAKDASSYAQASSNLSKAQTTLAYFVIVTALNMCAACQQLFGSVDRALAAPPGFTNALAAGAIAMALHLGPAGLYIAAAIYFFGVYKVEYQCPVPPPDTYARSDLDPPDDQLQYKWGDYYSDPSKPVQANPPPGQDKFAWAKNVQFADGNDPDLWMAWSRYYTGRLLSSLLKSGEAQVNRVNKPTQIITYRQANAAYFTPEVINAFGDLASSDPSVGLGFSETTTKTTDWVHVAYGGLF